MSTVDRKPISPSLLSDPAFSPDPYKHPYAVTNHEPWLASPPAGHPSLKRRARSNDFEPFPLIQPPNSPISFEKTKDPPAKDPEELIHTKERHRLPAEPSHQLWTLSPQSPRPPPSTKERSLMTFLRRRSPQQLQSTSSVVNPKPKKPSKLSKEAPMDVTRPSAHRQQTEPNTPTRPLALRSSMPPSVPPSFDAPSAVNSKRRATDIPAGRLQDLDRIDELDETNPWGVALHHGGPYDTAVQAIRKKDKKVFAGYGSYHRGVPQPNHNNNYAPPPAVSLSLNLLPGQILPRNPHSYNQPAPEAVSSIPGAVLMRPPFSAQTSFTPSPPLGTIQNTQSAAFLPLPSRRQSHQPPSPSGRDHKPRRQSYNPHPPITPEVSTFSISPNPPANCVPSQPHISPTPLPQPASPHSLPVLELPTRKPPNQEIEGRATQPRPGLGSIGIGMAMFEDDSDVELEGSELPAPHNMPSSNAPDTKNEELRRPGDVASRVVTSRSPTREDEQSPMVPNALQSLQPYSFPLDNAAFQHSQLSIPSQTSSKDSYPGSKAGQTGNGPQMAPHVTVEAEVIHRAPISQPSDPGSDISLIPRSTLRRSPECGHEDAGSTHPSVSSQSSSQSRKGPPPSRHVPKRLVMPAPLAWNNAAPSPPPPPHIRPPPAQGQARPPRALKPPPRVIPRVPVAALSVMPAPASTLPTVKAQAHEMHFAASKVSKLKKRVSLIASTPLSNLPSPIVTTVSFAPPVIQFEHPSATEHRFRQVMTESLITKRVLSKHKSG